eukprot:CAMPEP_0170515652 /NCGR_PEP_ID=MMETSP0209-20121228/2057_1 /TAXON_ID=665100 ORGANISM="Litonotus pictus, Strain P1" /NCGR_SAMPLE_ID=MMETSP0209 /ASSEMBLY_ACC=CAM_ASM_000301 /LENGTH=256 /DNA_ID=CAMNT_0010800235 /DNA_START=140 /DNA_END=910 /DNA_ORIENTATION=+
MYISRVKDGEGVETVETCTEACNWKILKTNEDFYILESIKGDYLHIVDESISSTGKDRWLKLKVEDKKVKIEGFTGDVLRIIPDTGIVASVETDERDKFWTPETIDGKIISEVDNIISCQNNINIKNSVVSSLFLKESLEKKVVLSNEPEVLTVYHLGQDFLRFANKDKKYLTVNPSAQEANISFSSSVDDKSLWKISKVGADLRIQSKANGEYLHIHSNAKEKDFVFTYSIKANSGKWKIVLPLQTQKEETAQDK